MLTTESRIKTTGEVKKPGRRQLKPEDRGRKPCISREGPLVPYHVKLPPSLKAWCKLKGPKRVRIFLAEAKEMCETLECFFKY